MAVSVGVERVSGRQPVMADVARLAGVSQKTVSRVINDAPNVRETVRARVLDAVAELGYRPNAAARALVTQQTRVLGVAMPGTTDYGLTAALFGIETAAWDLGYSVVVSSAPVSSAPASSADLASAPASSADFAGAVLRLVDQGVDGLVLNDPYVHHGLSPQSLRHVPAINIGEELVGGPRCPAVTVDQESGARQAVAHLLRLGHRTVHHLAGPLSYGAAVRRAVGWRDELVRAGAPVDEPLVGDWSSRSGYELGLVLSGDPAVTAVFAANDQMAIGAMRAFVETGRRVPQDVSVVGFDDTPDAAFQVIPLTTVRQDFTVVSRRAVTTLVSVVEGGPAADGTVRFPVELVVRSSSAPPPGVGRAGGPSP